VDASRGNTTQKVTFVVEIVLTVVVTIVMGIVAKNILEKKLKE
jgi:cell division protein FtsN